MTKAFFLSRFSPLHFFPSKERAKAAFKNPPKPIWTWLSAALIAANLFLFFSYIVGVNKNASQGYEIKQLQKQILSLGEENKSLTLKSAEISSIVAIQNDLESAGFVAADAPKFLEMRQYTLK